MPSLRFATARAMLGTSVVGCRGIYITGWYDPREGPPKKGDCIFGERLCEIEEELRFIGTELESVGEQVRAIKEARIKKQQAAGGDAAIA